MLSSDEPKPQPHNDDLTPEQRQVVSASLEPFLHAWLESTEVPEISDFLPDAPPQVQREALLEMLRIEQEQRHDRGLEPSPIETLLERHRELIGRDDLPTQMLYDECVTRLKTGEPDAVDRMLDRFPRQKDELSRLLDDTPLATRKTQTRSLAKNRIAFSVGDKLDDFELLTLLGKGTFAQVFLARQNSIQRLVALKVSANRGHETETLARLDHPHIVRIYDQRILPEQNLRLMYMKYEPGGTMLDVLRYLKEVSVPQRNGRSLLSAVDVSLERRGESKPIHSATRAFIAELDWPETVAWIGRQLADALQHAHAHGILHRDIKPANILFSSEAAPMLVDFNVSYNEHIEGMRPDSYFGGSLAYMSPEQLWAFDVINPADPADLTGSADVYALGVVLWELLAGQRPFEDVPMQSNRALMVSKMIEGRAELPNPAAVDGTRNQHAQPVAEVLRNSFREKLEERFADAAELQGQLNLCLHPRAKSILVPPKTSLRWLAQRSCVGLFIAIIVVLNLLAARFNFLYNEREIVRPLQDAGDAFTSVQILINAIAFPVGVLTCVLFGWPVLRRVTLQQSPPPFDSPGGILLRRRCLLIGHVVAIVCICAWVLAGIAYPIALDIAGVEVSSASYIHFAVSLAMCGLIAGTYPYFGITYLAIRLFYPMLLDPRTNLADDHYAIETTKRRTWYYLGLSLMVPWLGMTLLVGSDAERVASLFLCIASLVGCVATFFIARRIQNDLDAIAKLATSKALVDSSTIPTVK